MENLPPNPCGGRPSLKMKKEKPNKKEQELISIEIENCRQNIEFYKDQIGDMEKKLDDLEKIKKAYEYY